MKKDKISLLIVFGGYGTEHYVSCASAANILRHYDKEKFTVSTIGITLGGDWIMTEASPDEIENGRSWLEHPHNKQAIISPINEKNEILILDDVRVERKHIDCIFPMIHGKVGEDGSLQGILQMAGLPYVGCDLEASILGYDKAITKELVETLHIRQADYLILLKEDCEDLDKTVSEVDLYFKDRYPIFVKPSREGSSVGISKVKNVDGVKRALEQAFECDDKILIEEGIVGREIEVAVLKNKTLKASNIGEIRAADEFYSYDAKYNNNESVTKVANDIPEEISEKIKRASLRIFKKLGCKSLARVDFFLKGDGEFVFNEINTLPGFTSISMYPQLWQHEGVSYKELISELIESAMS